MDTRLSQLPAASSAFQERIILLFVRYGSDKSGYDRYGYDRYGYERYNRYDNRYDRYNQYDRYRSNSYDSRYPDRYYDKKI